MRQDARRGAAFTSSGWRVRCTSKEAGGHGKIFWAALITVGIVAMLAGVGADVCVGVGARPCASLCLRAKVVR